MFEKSLRTAVGAAASVSAIITASKIPIELNRNVAFKSENDVTIDPICKRSPDNISGAASYVYPQFGCIIQQFVEYIMAISI